MGLYINGVEYSILSPNGLLDLNFNPYNIITNGIKIFSSDNYIFKDTNNVYITFKKEDE